MPCRAPASCPAQALHAQSMPVLPLCCLTSGLGLCLPFLPSFCVLLVTNLMLCMKIDA